MTPKDVDAEKPCSRSVAFRAQGTEHKVHAAHISAARFALTGNSALLNQDMNFKILIDVELSDPSVRTEIAVN